MFLLGKMAWYRTEYSVHMDVWHLEMGPQKIRQKTYVLKSFSGLNKTIKMLQFY